MKMTKYLAALIMLVSFPLFAADTIEGISTTKSPVSSTISGVAIDGYDPVAYFNQGKAVQGKKAYTYEHNNVTWHFSTAENRDLFLQDPDKFSPQYGGYCAYSITNNQLYTSDPKAFVVRDDKLFLYINDTLRDKDIKESNISFSNVKLKRDKNWLTFQKNF